MISREPATACSSVAQRPTTSGVSFGRLLNDPKVTWPVARAGNGATAGARSTGRYETNGARKGTSVSL